MSHDDQTESVALSKGPCNLCGGTKCRTLYSDFHSYCHRCPEDTAWQAEEGYTGTGKGGASASSVTQLFPTDTGELLDASQQSAPWQDNTKRNVTAATRRKMGVFTAGHGGSPKVVYPYYDASGNLVAQKLRGPDKSFPVLKGPGYTALLDCMLFGQQVYGDKFDRQVVVVEGEEDQLAVEEELGGKAPVVSIPAGVGNAAKALKKNYLWLDRFTDIVLWFDNDEPGKQAIQECAPLFKVGKVRVATATGFMADLKTPCKDASDLRQAGRPGDIRSAIYAATLWRPLGIVNANANPEDVMAPKEGDLAFSYQWPWQAVTDFLGPQLPGQVCIHVAGTGIGKSTAVAHIAWDVIRQGGKVGYMSFEGTRREIKLSLMVVKAGKRVDLEPLPDADMAKLHEQAFGEGKMELFDPETAEWTLEACESYIRYMAKALDCQVIVIDPLSTLVAMADVDDERRAIDKVSMRTSKAAKELGIFIHISHHLSRPEGTPHEEGAPTSINQVRGSNGLANFATFVIGHERNQQAEGDDWTLTQLRSLKNRPRSRTGPMVVLEYSIGTGQLKVSTAKFPKPGKGGGEGERGGKGFGPATSNDY